MSGKVIVDSNVLIFFLKGYPETQKYFYDCDAYISFVSELEILSSPGLDHVGNDQLRKFMATRVILAYQPEFKEIIIKIRSSKKLKLPDAIIAATAIHFDIPLVSSDKGFKNIDGLQFYYHEPPIK